MNDYPLLVRLQEGITAILNLAADNADAVVETDDRFSLRIYQEVMKIGDILVELRMYANLIDVTLEYELHHEVRGSMALTSEGLQTIDQPDEIDPESLELDPQMVRALSTFVDELPTDRQFVSVEVMIDGLTQLHTQGIDTETSLFIVIRKRRLLQQLDFKNSAQWLLYVITDKLLERLRSTELAQLYNHLMPEEKSRFIILLGDASGNAIGPNVTVLGRDHWAKAEKSSLTIIDQAQDRVTEAIAFSDEECYWEQLDTALTPYHLNILQATLDRADLLKAVAQLRDRLSVIYLAERTQKVNDNLQCEFRGHKRIIVAVPALGLSSSDQQIFAFFAWAYENHSTDKLGIARQMISLVLRGEAVVNYGLLVAKAGDLLASAKSNFKLYLKRSVELYFDKRLRVSEYLQKFNNAVGDDISQITTELVGNLYKTVGLILAVVIAILVDPDRSTSVIALSALLYFIYIGFILIYLLPSVYVRYKSEVEEYEQGVSELLDILSEEELNRIQGMSFQQARRNFGIFFWATFALYVLFAVLAFLIARYSILAI